jgi:hypothetical protein
MSVQVIRNQAMTPDFNSPGVVLYQWPGGWPHDHRRSPSLPNRRPAWQEFGDVLAEGLYALLQLDLGIQHATREYWIYFLEARRNFLESITTRSRNAHPEIRGDMMHSVQSALKCSLKIKPDLCERYI